MSTPTDEKLAEWRKVTDAATDGPWSQEHDGGFIVHGPEGSVLEAIYEPANATFAAMARTAMPLLLDHIEGCQAFEPARSKLKAMQDELNQRTEEMIQKLGVEVCDERTRAENAEAEVERLQRELTTKTEVARSNKRHVQSMAEEVERLNAENAGLSDLLDEVCANQLSILLSSPALDALETVIVDLDGEREYAVDIIEKWRERLAAPERRNVVADNPGDNWPTCGYCTNKQTHPFAPSMIRCSCAEACGTRGCKAAPSTPDTRTEA